MTEAEVTAAGIARLAGVGRAAVSNWRRRYDDFPAPVGGTDTRPTFPLAEVERWLEAQGRRRPVAAERQVWQQLDALRGEAKVDEVLTAVGAFLIYVDRAPRGVPSWRTLQRASDSIVARRLTPAIRQTVGDLAKPALELIDRGKVPMLRAVAELAAELTPPTAFDRLCEQYVDSVGRQQAVTPTPLADLMVDLAGGGRTVLDPACGTGTLLLAGVRAGATDPVGQEVVPSLADLTAIRLMVHGGSPRIEAGDSFRADAFTGLKADAVVVNPPFGARNWGQEELELDARWQFGVPARSEPELAWVQHALSHVRKGGGVAVLMPPAAGLRRSGRRVRAELLRRGCLRAVIGLPPAAVSSTAVPLQLWVLRQPIFDQGMSSDVLFVDTSGPGGAHVDWARVAATAKDAWRAFERGSLAETPGVRRAVPVIDLLDDEVDLTPARNLPLPVEVVSSSDLRDRRTEIESLAAELPSLVPEVEVRSQGTEPWTTVTVGELARSGALSIRQSSTHAESDDAARSDEPVLTSRDLMAGRSASGRISSADLGPAPVRVQSRDVVIPAVGTSTVARVMTDDGAILGRGLHLLRPDPDVLDPWFLAGFLRSSANARQASTFATAASRIDIRRAQLPRLPLTEQRRYGAVFRRIDELERRTHDAADAGERLARQLADGITAGTLAPMTET